MERYYLFVGTVTRAKPPLIENLREVNLERRTIGIDGKRLALILTVSSKTDKVLTFYFDASYMSEPAPGEQFLLEEQECIFIHPKHTSGNTPLTVSLGELISRNGSESDLYTQESFDATYSVDSFKRLTLKGK